MYHRTETRLRTAADVADDVVDAVVLAGDLTRDGRASEYAAVDTVLADLSAPLVAVRGNHNVPKRWDVYVAPTAAEFGGRYGLGPYPFHARVGGRGRRLRRRPGVAPVGTPVRSVVSVC